VRRLQQPGDDVGCLAIARFEEVGVHVQGRRRVGVAEAAAHRTNRNACGQKLSRVEVMEVVESDAGQAKPTAQTLK
jgi:hypothetical protein